MSTAGSAVVVVGAGHAGAEAATAVRQAGHEGPIVLIGEEAQLPYHRPPLSKAYLAGTSAPEALLLKQQAVYDKAGVELRTGVRAEQIDRAEQALVLSDGGRLAYSALILATGSRPRLWSVTGLDPQARPANLFYLRTRADADAMRERLAAGKRLLVIGAGYIGLEIAAVAVKAGLQVAVLEAQDRVLARVAAPVVSNFFERLHRDAGVTVRTGVQVERAEIAGNGDITAVTTVDGTRYDTDLVVAGIGVVPNVELAQAAGLTVDNGIVVDEFMRTSDANILAIGDCSNHPSPVYGRRIRLESVPNALEQARIAAGVLCGKPQAYASIPWFWSDQYDIKLQMVGLSHGYDQAVVRGAADGKSFSAFYLRDGVVVSADCVNRVPEFMLAKKLVASQRKVDAAQLADESIPLKTLVEQLTA